MIAASTAEKTICTVCVTITVRRLSKRSVTTPAEEPEHRERPEPADREHADGEAARVRRELDDEPRHRDVLHPRAGDRRQLAGEEEAVVAVAFEGDERPCRRELEQRHRPGASSSFSSAGSAASIDSRSSGVRPFRCSASHAVRRRLTSGQHLVAGGGHGQSDAAAVGSACALDQPRRLQPDDVAGHAGRGNALALCELGGGDPGARLDLDEQADLPAGHAERVDLAAQLAPEAEQDGPQAIRKGGSTGARGLVSHLNH